MAEAKHISRICTKCGGQLPMDAETCPWCHAPAAGHDAPQRIRVRKKRSVLKTYFEHVRRHWIFFFLAILTALLVAGLLLHYIQRPERREAPAPAFISLFP